MGLTFALPLCVTFPPKPDELFRNIQVNDGITTLYTVPSLLEQLIRELLLEKNKHIGLKPLQTLKFVMYSGAACPEEICKTLVHNGVRLISNYGSTG
jgi:acyl-CoA synthetase (AMP-forming)/AMP-acid ligase II